MSSVIQPWVNDISMMQQTVLLTAVRGPDGMPKYCAAKFLLRWFRRCVLLSAMDGKTLSDPCSRNGGSFTGPSCDNSYESSDGDVVEKGWEHALEDADVLGKYLRELDAVPHHFQLHFMHAVEILGYKHPDERIRVWWHVVYERLVNDMHLHPETEQELDLRLGDSREGWLKRADKATLE